MYEEYYEEVDLVCGMEMFAGLSILDFEDETYATLIKCAVLSHLWNKTSDVVRIVQRYVVDENDKLRAVAEWTLSELEKSRRGSQMPS